MFSWGNCGLYQTPTVNETSKYAIGGFYLKGKEKKPHYLKTCAAPAAKHKLKYFY